MENDGLRPVTLDMSEVEIISSSDSSTTISDTNTTTEATTPKTGDNSDLYVWYIILVAAISVKSHIPDIFPDIKKIKNFVAMIFAMYYNTDLVSAG